MKYVLMFSQYYWFAPLGLVMYSMGYPDYDRKLVRCFTSLHPHYAMKFDTVLEVVEFMRRYGKEYGCDFATVEEYEDYEDDE
jgi:hypothetical protein